VPEVVLVRWPEERDEAARLAEAGVAILYLVEGDEHPPVPASCLEDWIRLPGDDGDLRARVEALEVRALVHRGPPRVDGEGRLHYDGRVIVLPESEARLARVLAERFENLVTDDELALEGESASRALRMELTHLRAQLRDLDLALRRVRGRGYVLQRRIVDKDRRARRNARRAGV
jgi:hypothetical protein